MPRWKLGEGMSGVEVDMPLAPCILDFMAGRPMESHEVEIQQREELAKPPLVVTGKGVLER